MLEKVAIYCDSRAVGPTMITCDSKPLKTPEENCFIVQVRGHVQIYFQVGARTKKQKL